MSNMSKNAEKQALTQFLDSLGGGYLKDALKWQYDEICANIDSDLVSDIGPNMTDYTREMTEQVAELEKQEKDLLTSISELRSAYDRLTLDGIKARRDLETLKTEARRIAGMVA